MPLLGNSISPTLRNEVPLREKQSSEDLLHALIDRANDWHPLKDGFAERDQRPPRQIGGEKTEQRQAEKGEDDAEARQLKGQPDGDDLLHPIVDRIDEPPDEIKRDSERARDDDPGQKPVADLSSDPGDPWRSPGRVRKRGMIGLVHWPSGSASMTSLGGRLRRSRAAGRARDLKEEPQI